jgi:hypothetical protein
MPAERVGALEPSCRNTAGALALTIVRDGVITGEGPTTKGRVHFSRALTPMTPPGAPHPDRDGGRASAGQPCEAEALFEINDAAAERSDDGRFDDLLAKAVVHHAASASGLPVPSRTVALSPDTAIESRARTKAVGARYRRAGMDRQPDARHTCSNCTLMPRMVATIVGARRCRSLPNVFDIGM